MPLIPADFASELEAHGFKRVASFRRFYDVHEHLAANPAKRRYLIAYVRSGIWSAYPATLVKLQPWRCMFEYDNQGEGPQFTTDDSLPLQDQLPRRMLDARSCNYFLFTQ